MAAITRTVKDTSHGCPNWSDLERSDWEHPDTVPPDRSICSHSDTRDLFLFLEAFLECSSSLFKWPKDQSKSAPLGKDLQKKIVPFQNGLSLVQDSPKAASGRCTCQDRLSWSGPGPVLMGHLTAATVYMGLLKRGFIMLFALFLIFSEPCNAHFNTQQPDLYTLF